MKTTFFRIILTTFAFSLLCENKVQAAVESLGDKASITIPNTWTVIEKTASTLQASNPSNAVEISIGHFLPDSKSTITGGTYEEWNNILEMYLNSIELEMMETFTEYGYPITEIGSNPVFSGGISQNKDFYVAALTRNYSIFVDPSIFGMAVTSQFLSDGARAYNVRLIIYDWASQSEINEAIETLNSLKSTNVSLPLVDSDGDGVDNFDEIILYGTNPNSTDIPQGTTYQGPTITSDLSSVSVPVSQNIIPYAVSTNFGANAFTATGLPKGVKIDTKTGVITGKPTKKGTFTVRVTASKKQGKVVTDSVMTSKSVIVY
jgi:hypothetical protein